MPELSAEEELAMSSSLSSFASPFSGEACNGDCLERLHSSGGIPRRIVGASV
jgi:hypothetical protein